jgi:putative inorganic carbon (HCO3(-)) transporter
MGALGLVGTRAVDAKFPLIGSLAARFPLLLKGLPGAVEGIHPNELAGALTWTLPPSLILALGVILRKARFPTSIKPAWRWILVIGLIGAALLSTVAFLFSQSRGAYLGVTIALGVGLAVILPDKFWRLAYLLVVMLVATLGVYWLYVKTSSSPLAAFDPTISTELSATGLPGASLSLSSLEARVEIWSRAIYGIQDFPFTGMGMNTFRRVVQVLYPLFRIGPDVDIGHAHNEMLQAALDLGIPGLIAFLSICLLTGWLLARAYRGAKGAERWAVLGLGAGFAGHFLYGMTDAVALGARPGFLFWMLIGLIASASQNMNHEGHEEHQGNL